MINLKIRKFQPKRMDYNILMKKSDMYTKSKKLSLDNSTLKTTSNNHIKL